MRCETCPTSLMCVLFVLFEYDNTQDNANHIHSVWRDLRNDWGEDLLKEHYTRSHGASG